MTDVKRLLAERLQYHLGDVIGGDPDWDDFASRLGDEINLAAYEDLRGLIEPAMAYFDHFVNVDEAMRDGFNVTMWCEAASDALRRLREAVPA